MIETILRFIEIGGLPLIFLFLLLEGNPIIGSFIPGAVIVIFVGFFVSSYNLFGEYLSLFIVFISSFLGDLIGFYMGKKIGVKNIEKLNISKNSIIFNSSEKFFKKYGALSVILGRLFNFTRAFIPFFAGLFDMTWKKFIFIAIISNLIFSILFFYLGYFFGLVVINKINYLVHLILFIIIYLIILSFILKSFHKFKVSNRILFEEFSFMNIFFILFLFLLISILIFINRLNLSSLFNDFFSFLYISNFSYLGIFYFLNILLYLFPLFIILFLVFKKDFRNIVNFAWGSFLTLFFIIFGNSFFFNNFKFQIHPDLVFFSYFLFFLSIIIKKEIINKKILYYFELFILILMFLIFYFYFLLTQNFYEILFSLIYGVLITEIIIIMSHFEILDKEFCNYFKESALFKTKKE